VEEVHLSDLRASPTTRDYTDEWHSWNQRLDG